MKRSMYLAFIIVTAFLSSGLLFGAQVNDESGVAIKEAPLHYAGQSGLMMESGVKVRKPASANTMNRYYRFFNSKEDNYKNLYFSDDEH